MIRIGILGAGGIVKAHIEACGKIEGVNVTAIASRNRKRAEGIAADYNISHVFDSYEALVDQGAVDAIINCTPNFLHAPLSIRALERGLPVLCEKPLATSYDETLQMLAAAERGQTFLIPAMCRRFQKKTEIARDIIQSGSLGDIYNVKAQFLRRDGQPGGWFTDKKISGGGALIDIGVHAMDLALHLTNPGKPSRVSGHLFFHPEMMDEITDSQRWESVNKTNVRDVETYATGSVVFSSGILMQIEAGWNQHRERDEQRMEIYGTKGGLIVDPELKLFTNIQGSFGTTEIGYNLEYDEIPQYMYKQVLHFINAIRGIAPSVATAKSAIDSLEIIDAIYKSDKEKREVIL